MTKPIRTMLALAALSVSAALFSTTAGAATAQLRYKDLDLTTEAGRAELDRRIQAVAEQACPLESVTGTRIPDREDQARCMAEVRSRIETRLAGRQGRNNYGR